MGETETVRRVGASAAALLLVLSLSSCIAPKPCQPTPTTTEKQSARLAAAVDAYTVFNAALDGYISGSSTVEVLEPLVTPDYYDVLAAEDVEFRARDTFTVGASSFSQEKLEDADAWGGFGEIALVICRDISRTRVVDSDGAPSTATPIRTRIPTIAFLVADGDALLISKVDQWNEDGYCS